MKYTQSVDGTARITLRAEIRLIRAEHERLAALASHRGLSVKDMLDRCLRTGLRDEMDEASGGTPQNGGR